MTIHVSRCGQTFAATVVYNFRQVNSAILLKMHQNASKDKSDYLLLFNLERREWEEVGGLHTEDPEFFNQILQRLQRVLSEAEKQTVMKENNDSYS